MGHKTLKIALILIGSIAVLFASAIAPAYIFGDRPSGTALFDSVSMLLMLIIVLGIRKGVFDRATGWLNGNADRVVGAVVLAVLVAFSILNYQRFRNFSFIGSDITYYVQSLHTTLHGNVLFGNLWDERGVFSVHFAPFLFLLLPVYSLSSSPLVLLIVRVIFLALSCVPLYLLVREKLTKAVALVITLSYLVSLPILSQFTFGLYLAQFAPFFVLMAYYAFTRDRFVAFLVYLALLLSLREEMSSIAVMFGIYALIMHRKKRWVIVPFALGVLWFWFSYFYIIPKFSPIGAYDIKFIVANQSNLQAGHLLKNSVSFLSLCYAYTLLSPFLYFVPFLSFEFLLVLPLVIGVLATDAGRYAKSINFHYHSVIVAMLTLSAVSGMRRVMKIKPVAPFFRTVEQAYLVCALAFFLVNVTILFHHRDDVKDSLSSSQCWKGSLSTEDYREATGELFRLIPKEASVATPRYLSPHIANRVSISMVLPENAQAPSLPDYIIVDKNTTDPRTWEWINDRFCNNREYASRYEEVYGRNGLFLYRLRSGAPVHT